jgi:hypothetical protein
MQHFLATSQHETTELHSLFFSGYFGLALPQCIALVTPCHITLFNKVMYGFDEANQLHLHFRNGGRN